jgi:hypothetical protein
MNPLQESLVNSRAVLDTPMSPLAMGITLLLALIVLFRSRHAAMVAIIAAVAFLPQSEALSLGFHFYVIRLVLLAGLIRVFIRGENAGFRPGPIDRGLLFYALTILVVASLRVPGEFTFRLGNFYDVSLGYFVFRCLLKNEEDFRLVLTRAAYLVLVPFAALMTYECFTGRNPFSIFNGVIETSWVRAGHTRAQGPFRNPITAGAFGATFAMFYASLFFSRLRSRPVLIGLAASIVITLNSHSSGPFLGMALGLLALFMWYFRSRMKVIRLGIVLSLVGLELVMKSNVWFLIGRISEITGGGGYHRAELIEQAVRHFDDWWLAGTVDTASWFPYEVNGKADITNFFVAAGVDAGVLGVIFAVVLIIACFRVLSRGLTRERTLSGARLLWGLGATLVASLGILFSVTYMDQMQVVFYLLLTSIAALAVPSQAGATVLPAPAPARRLERIEWREKILHI